MIGAMTESVVRPGLLFDKRNRNVPAEVVFDSPLAITFHYAFVAIVVAAEWTRLAIAVEMLVGLAVIYLLARRFARPLFGHARARSTAWLGIPVEFQHRNFCLLFCCYLLFWSSPALPRVPLLIFGAAIDSYREYRIARCGSGSPLDLALTKIESAIQRALIPPWPFVAVATSGVIAILSLESTNPDGAFETAVAAAFSYIGLLAPEIDHVPANLATLGLPDKYHLVLAEFGFVNMCGLVYLLLAFLTQQRAQAGWVKWNQIGPLRSAYLTFVGTPVACALQWSGLHTISHDIAHSSIFYVIGNAQMGNEFVIGILFKTMIGTMLIALIFFHTGIVRRMYS